MKSGTRTMGQAVFFESGWAKNILKFQNWGRHHGKGKGNKGSIKKPRKRDFDETHNFGLGKQSKAEVNHY